MNITPSRRVFGVDVVISSGRSREPVRRPPSRRKASDLQIKAAGSEICITIDASTMDQASVEDVVRRAIRRRESRK